VLFFAEGKIGILARLAGVCIPDPDRSVGGRRSELLPFPSAQRFEPVEPVGEAPPPS